MVCRSLLLILERKQYIVLPPRIKSNNNSGRRICPQVTIETNQQAITGQVKDLMPIVLRLVRRSPEERLCNSLIQHHHYLGYSRPVSEHLKYLAFASEPLAVFCGAWSVFFSVPVT
jgi:hypothetical protein